MTANASKGASDINAGQYAAMVQGTTGAVGAYMGYMADQADAQNQLFAIGLQRESNALRKQQQLKQLRRSAKRLQAKQKGKYLSSGVKLEGSAITVLGDALANELEASLAIEQTAFETERSLMLAAEDTKSKAAMSGITRTMQGITSTASAAGSAYGAGA